MNPFSIDDSEEHTINPFSVGLEDHTVNPFADPAISNSLEQHSHDTRVSFVPDVQNTAFHESERTVDPQLAAREQQLLQREQELAEREQEFRRQQDQLRLHGAYPPNWPSFYPLIRHNIDVDIPEEHQSTIRMIYKYWMAVVGLLTINMIVMLIILFSHPSNMDYLPGDFGVALVYLVFISAASFITWYLPIYMAYMKNSSLYSYIFLVFNGFHILFACYMAVGIPRSGACGMITVLAVFADGKVLAGVFACLAFAGWVASAIYSIYLWRLVNDYNKTSGHTFEGARDEAVSVGVQSGVAERIARQQYSRA
ncbi:hypothetical protein BATDEDRAFT_91951 [Batrachochytrium dendrobatidis JAM81]|uniref:Scamp-domain-containing protein n=2 Tax=Batrachochytrium dendrobatidis TaxID=109871 RepID=F4PCB0_BATDJ|nr:uncharacterized protein BATDEDRAFT_91951 [Batrachochytrium dendrobatidis JAM81]EGF77128.1 hypothetical protein BATDEDRAFT_91951 [Batrachochytrium dendrobatidis JAM81]OAJ44666.1 hypothetical protein BDEG_27875 [Batrachochytrium dendrobatidis JEL423]|eukprot:XP_006682283.1 hypothetical protein BATDEDRAFT_91951 [Batrachochytrium dendrobatidis JAM81]